MSNENIKWHEIIQEILDNHLDLMSGKKIIKPDKEQSTYFRVDYLCKAQEPETKSTSKVLPFDHFKGINTIEYKSSHESLNESTFRQYIGRALLIENPIKAPSEQGNMTLTIFTTRKPHLLKDETYKFTKINEWKYQSNFFKDLDIFILIQSKMRYEQAGEALALLQILECDEKYRKSVWHAVLSNELHHKKFIKDILGKISKEDTMTVVEEIKLEGKLEGKLEVAKKLLQRGIDISIIVETTGIPEEKLNEFKTTP